MALPATDSFTTAAPDKALTTYSASWTLNKGNFLVLNATDDLQSNTSGSETGAHWNADAFDADQYAECENSAITTAVMGPAVRCDTGGDDYYYGFYGSSTASYLFKVINGAWTQLGLAGGAVALNEVMRLEISGVDPGTLIPYVDDVEEDPPGDQDDSDIDSGAAGVCGYHNNSARRIDNWEGGNLAGAPARRIFITHW